MFNPNDHLMDLKGKKYLQVMWRLVWFREEKPLWSIDTHLEQLTDNHAVFSAKIFDENGVQKSAGYGSESVKDFRDFIEKAETKAVGRALAMLGYGTQFSPEMDEGERIVDTPVNFPAQPTREEPSLPLCSVCGQPIDSRVNKGRLYGTAQIVENTIKLYGHQMCWDCMLKTEGDKKNA